MQKIGVVGLGIMGQGMVSNFLKHGYEVFVWNRTATAAQSLAEQGAILCETPAEVARQAEIIFEVTANDASSQSVWTGESGILVGAIPRKILIVCATLSIEWVDKLAQVCQKAGLTFLDMAMTGGRVGAETGALTLLCGGDKKILNTLEPTLAAIAKKVIHFGPVGHGMRYKLILNFLQGLHILGFGEAMKIAEHHDMNLEKVAEALAERPGGVITGIAKQAYFTEPDPVTFSVEWLAKDVGYAKQFARDLHTELLNTVLTTYQKAVSQGLGKKDWASVNTLLEEVI